MDLEEDEDQQFDASIMDLDHTDDTKFGMSDIEPEQSEPVTIGDESDGQNDDHDEVASGDEALCPICLDLLPDPNQEITRTTRSTQLLARTSPCNHHYHDFCIKEWSQKANSCPQCRSSFQTIELLSKSQVVESIAVEDKKFPVELDDSDFAIPPEFEPNPTSGLTTPASSNVPPPALPEFRHQHLSNPMCCLCDSSTRSAFAICQDCSSGFHLSCLGILDVLQYYCPMCDSVQGRESVIMNNRSGARSRGGSRRETSTFSPGTSFMRDFRTQIRNNRLRDMGVEIPVRKSIKSRSSTLSRRALQQQQGRVGSSSSRLNVDDDGIDYVAIVDRNKKLQTERNHREMMNNTKTGKASEESMAWHMLDKLQHRQGSEPKSRTATPPPSSSSPVVEKFKRPKRATRKFSQENSHNQVVGSSSNLPSATPVPTTQPLELTTEALSRHNSLSSAQRTSPPASSLVAAAITTTTDSLLPPLPPPPSFTTHADNTLAYTQKLFIQHVLIKQTLKKIVNGVSVNDYTEINKRISRVIYKLVSHTQQQHATTTSSSSSKIDFNPWLNKLNELMERQGVTGREQFDKFIGTELDEGDLTMLETFKLEFNGVVRKLVVDELERVKKVKAVPGVGIGKQHH